MKAMILAAGKGERMRPLTDTMPKPLLRIGDKPMLQYHIEALRAAGIRNLVINHARMGDKIEKAFGTGKAFDVSIEYSAEGDEPLETGGGIKKALPLLGEEPFIVVNGDIWCDYQFDNLPAKPSGQAHLVMVENPQHNLSGDFSIEDGLLCNSDTQRYTFSGIAVYRATFFRDSPSTAFKLAPLLREAADRKEISAELFSGRWFDIGTPERLNEAKSML